MQWIMSSTLTCGEKNGGFLLFTFPRSRSRGRLHLNIAGLFGGNLAYLKSDMQKVADPADISVLFFSAGANFWPILGNFWAILAILGNFWAICGKILLCAI